MMGRVRPDREPGLLTVGCRFEIEPCGHLASQMLLSAPDEGDGRAVIEPGFVSQQAQCPWTVRKLPHVRCRSAQKVPCHAQLRTIEVIALGLGLPAYWPKGRTFHHDSEPALLAYVRPACLVPLDRGQERLAPQVGSRRDPLRTHTQTHQPPTAVVGLDEIGVTKRLERAVEAAMGQDGILRATLPGSPWAIAPGNRH